MEINNFRFKRSGVIRTVIIFFSIYLAISILAMILIGMFIGTDYIVFVFLGAILLGGGIMTIWGGIVDQLYKENVIKRD